MIFNKVFNSKYKSEEDIRKALFSNNYWYRINKYANPDGIPVVWGRIELRLPIMPQRAKLMKKAKIPKILELMDSYIDDTTKLVYVSIIEGDAYLPLVQKYIEDSYSWDFIKLTNMKDLKYSVSKDLPSLRL